MVVEFLSFIQLEKVEEKKENIKKQKEGEHMAKLNISLGKFVNKEEIAQDRWGDKICFYEWR